MLKVSRNYSDENGCSPSPTGDTRIVMKCIQNMGVIGFFITTGDGSTVVSWSTTLSLWGQIQRRTPSYMLTCKVGLKPHLNIDTSTMNSSSPIVLFTNTYLPFRGAFWMEKKSQSQQKKHDNSLCHQSFQISQSSKNLGDCSSHSQIIYSSFQWDWFSGTSAERDGFYL